MPWSGTRSSSPGWRARIALTVSADKLSELAPGITITGSWRERIELRPQRRNGLSNSTPSSVFASLTS